ncbi:PEP/pyruvate-binding domain-containing protein [Streptosporangium saharense]|uniref:PEP/pyruvate-binding domain-containing protein n=1 Tax=Streptosporangium saharense TaxID=1706840 RepID=UPI003681FE57
MIVPLAEATADTCGGKAGALGTLLRAGLPVPDGFVLPFAAYLDATVLTELGGVLDELGDPPVAVRSSASNEDTAQASAAGQYDSFLAVRGIDAVADAVRACWASLLSPRAVGHRADPVMAVIVQRHLDAEASGVMFTPANPDDTTEIEASWGLGPSVVGGTVTPDAYRVSKDGSTTHTIADKQTRLDRYGTRLVVRDVPEHARRQPAIDDATATRLAELGREIAALLGGPQDIEWAIVDGRVWVLQARPVTAALPRPSALSTTSPAALTGTPGSHGTATGTARVVRGPADFARVRPGDILVCPFTDPAWTPLLRVVSGVVTETGGVLSHAAIVAREHAIPAVLGVPDATSRLRDNTVITVDGTAGTVMTPSRSEGDGSRVPGHR